MSLSKTAAALVALLLVTAPGGRAAEPLAGPTADLSPELRAAFVAEMQGLEASLQRVVSGLARGDWPGVEHAAHQIRGSFILAQRLSPEQRAELHRVLPEPFLALDQSFHEGAERLAVAAKGGDAELVTFFTYKLTEACVSCHAAFAPQRFPGLSSRPKPHDH